MSPTRAKQACLVAARFVRDRYLILDTRVLGVFRVWLGLVILAEMKGRLARSTFFYSNDGCLSNHHSIYAPLSRPYFSVFVMFSTPGEVRLALIATTMVYVAYTLGYRTRLAQLLTLVLYTSLNARNLFLESGGTVIIGILAAWTLFLPLGDRFSVDAFLTSVRSRRASRGPLEGRASSVPAADRSPSSTHVSLAALAIALQIAAIYTFNVLNKTGQTWRAGEVIHLVMWQNRIATPIAAWLRMHEPLWLSPLLTRTTLYLEGAPPFLVLLPFAQRYARTANFFMTAALHGGISLLLSLGPFSYVMIALNLLLLPREAADWVARRFEGGRLVRAVAAIEGWAARHWPFGGQVGTASAASRARRSSRLGVGLREGYVFVLMLAVGIQVTDDNAAVPARLRLHQPAVLAALIDYPRLAQGWSMFAPDAPGGDGMVVVDGVTEDGRHIDPFSGEAPDLDAPLHGPWYLEPLLGDYFGRIIAAGDYQPELEAYLMNWQEIEGRPTADRLVSLTAYWVYGDAPRRGKTTPRNVRRRVMFAAPSEPPPREDP